MSALITRTFKSGNSVAIRLPKALAIGPDERMLIEQHGSTLIIRRAHDPAVEKRKVAAMLAALAKIGAPDDGIQDRPDFEAPERPGI